MKRGKLALALLLPLQAACASIVTGSQDTVMVRSNPPGAHFRTNSGHSGTTPTAISIPDSLVLEVEYSLEGYVSARQTLEPFTSPWICGNLLLGVGGIVIGVPIDLATGGAKTHKDSITADLLPLASAPAPSSSL